MTNFAFEMLRVFGTIGDHIRIHNGVYYHHMLVVEVIDSKKLMVIHYTENDDHDGDKVVKGASASSSLTERGKVKEETTEVDPTGKKVELLEYAEPGVAIYTGQEAIKRARGRVGETNYSLLKRNCESFVNWVITDREETNQGELGRAAVVGGIALGIGAVLTAALGGNKDDKDSDKKKKPK